ncbi:MAG: hypothetical protein ACTH1D_14030 [Mycobacteriaceae bacterium]|uniref:hypothetical protein n=1 Tax=Corynebacterium sp. TaxID=1720 RepID=UPI003F9CF5BB
MTNPLSKLLDWYRSPTLGDSADTAASVLGVLPTRQEDLADRAHTDVVAHLIASGRTPATAQDVDGAFHAIHGRTSTLQEYAEALALTDSFGLLVRPR